MDQIAAAEPVARTKGHAFTAADLPALERVWLPTWVFDSERRRMVWGNPAALELWRAASLDDFRARDFTDMSEGVATRLAAILDHVRHDGVHEDEWTFYPLGTPVRCRVRRSAFRLEDGRVALLHEALRIDPGIDAATLRGVEALTHTSVMISLYSEEGEVLMRNPAAKRAYGALGIEGRFDRAGSHFRLAEERATMLEALRRGEVYTQLVEVETLRGMRWHGLDARIARDPVTGGRAILVNERDVTELRRLERTATERRTFLRAVLDVVADAVFVHDDQGRFVLSNTTNAENLGRRLEELEGRSLRDLVPPEVARAWEAENRAIIESGRETVQEQAFPGPDGAMRTYRVSKRPFTIEGGGRFVAGTATDISELKAAKERAQAGERARAQFLAMMSHEIRTPMTGVMGLAELLRETELSPQQREYVDTLHDSARALLRILNDILDFSKIEAGKLTVDAVDVDLPALVHEVHGLLATLARDKGLAFTVTVDPELPRHVRCDPVRLRQILVNLAGNALKFTESGAVEVLLEGAEAGGDVDFRLTVRDTGIGMSGEQLTTLFQPFTQADGSTTRRFGGTGLGLAITKALVDAMGGTLRVVSRPGEGSAFQVALRCPPGCEPKRETARIERALCPARVLLAEDNLVNRTLIETMLVRMGHTVEAVADGRAAVERLASGAVFDIVLMDLQMPVMDGIEATRAIRGMPGPTADIPVVALSADVLPENRAAQAGAGLDGFLPKPVEWEALARIVADAAARRPPLLDGAAVAQLRAVIGGEALARMVAALADQLDEEMPRLRAAVERGETDRALRLVHAIRGSAGSFGAVRLCHALGGVKDRIAAGDRDPAAIDALVPLVAETLGALGSPA
ncbi:MAG TPA: ATP-binding protein [Azospirillaceae bacterium]|nr:ATP-binding protein [Azospirillaceae bacterium]